MSHKHPSRGNARSHRGVTSWRGMALWVVRLAVLGPWPAAEEGNMHGPSWALSTGTLGSPAPHTCSPCPIGPGKGNGASPDTPRGCASLPVLTKPSPPPPGDGWASEGANRERWGLCVGLPFPTFPRRPCLPLPLGRGWGASPVAMAAALRKLQLGNYCEHPSCLRPAPELGS